MTSHKHTCQHGTVITFTVKDSTEPNLDKDVIIEPEFIPEEDCDEFEHWLVHMAWEFLLNECNSRWGYIGMDGTVNWMTRQIV